MKVSIIILSLLLVLSLIRLSHGISLPFGYEANLIKDLPGQPPANFSQYAGRIQLDAANRALFYWLIEATTDSEEKPLVLWLNGGPGCSSFIGLFHEIGPFKVQQDGSTLSGKPYAWNTEANLLFLESPVGVGFSIAGKLENYGDNQTAEDSYCFLINWLERFPQYIARDFYLAGESYAGHYIPQLAEIIVKRMDPKINFKGFLLGNPTIDTYNDYAGQFDYWWNHGLISDSTYAMKNSCLYDSFLRPVEPCHWVLREKDQAIRGINNNNILTNPCNIVGDSTYNSRGQLLGFSGNGDEFCHFNSTVKYLNNVDVQKAIYADNLGEVQDWTLCRTAIYINWDDSPNSVLPIIKELIAQNIRMWLFSGDVDAQIPVTSTRYSIKALDLEVEKNWYPWIDENEEVGGWSEVYKGLTFITIRKAGHTVPLYRPQQALLMFKKFLMDEPMPEE